MLSLLPIAQAAAQLAWHYTLGELRSDQQANFCETEQSVMEIAGLFERFSPRTGYSALADSPDCTLSVHSFVPEQIIAEVKIATDEAGDYHVTFVRVRTLAGDPLFLITTRKVQASP